MTALRCAPAGPDTGIDEQLVCCAVVPVTHDVTSFVLASPTGRRFAFDPGQYVTVAVTVAGHRLERCYTISSAPDGGAELTITVKRVPGGSVSNWLHDRFAPGHRLHVTGPFGVFSTVAHPAASYLFLSAGSGVTPLMSMTRALLDDPSADVVFVHSARTPRDILFRAELDAIAASRPGIRVTAVCADDAPGERWGGPRGRLGPELLRAAAPDLTDREVFTCGPPPYRQAVREILRAAGADPARCHEESYLLSDVVAPVAPSGAAPVAATGAASGAAPVTATDRTVDFRRSGTVVACRAGESVLQAGLRAGVALPSSCGAGMCGTCRHTLLGGRVDMQHQGGIRPRDIARGEILLCCSSPLEDLVVDA